MAVLGVKRRRDRRSNRRKSRAQDTYNEAYENELARQAELRKQEMQREVFQTTEGEGIMEGATISLGFDDDEEDDDLMGSYTGLII